MISREGEVTITITIRLMAQIHMIENIIVLKLQAIKKKQRKTIIWGVPIHFVPEGVSRA